jgi:NADH:ubiquinone oxidoreductase subunit 5 (subunit L)/multisubunit Na+/H+ antiporter MnhA subunit
LHREPGFFRFFFILNLFTAAMLLLVMAGNAVMCFVGWELAGLCSYLLIAYFYDRPIPARNATRVFITNRIGDAAFVLGIALAILWFGSADWTALMRPEAGPKAGVLAFCFVIAACAKSAQFPFTPWLARAMEGPTPSSALFYGAVMVHAGVYLVLRLQPLIEQSSPVMSLLILVGSATALYGYIGGLVQTDIKSALIFSTSAQVGLMFLLCGLGFWSLALVHLAAHAIVRGYQFLTAPSILKQLEDVQVRRVAPLLANTPMIYSAALQRFWVDELADYFVSRPVQHIAAELDRIDTDVVDHLAGLPAPTAKALSSLAHWEERKLGASPDAYTRNAEGARLPYFISQITQDLVEALHRFEQGVILQLAGLLHLGRHLARLFLRAEVFLAEPRKIGAVLLVLFVLIASGTPL